MPIENDFVEFLVVSLSDPDPMTILELVAALIGILSVVLTVKQNIWCWPTGIVMVAMYIVIFGRSRLYADAGLQVVYLLLQVYGWHQWVHGGDHNDELPVSWASGRLLAALLALGAVVSVLLGWSLAQWTDQDLSYLDSTITAFSLVAQWMLARKFLQNWLLWIGVDVLAVGVYAAKELYPTAVLYAIFLLLAVAGFLDWRRSYRESVCSTEITPA